MTFCRAYSSGCQIGCQYWASTWRPWTRDIAHDRWQPARRESHEAMWIPDDDHHSTALPARIKLESDATDPTFGRIEV